MKYVVFILGFLIVGATILLFTIPTPHKNIQVTSLKNGDIITSPLHIEGMARGTWFFEGDAPVLLVGVNDRILSEGYITAQGDAQTEEFLPFIGRIEFDDVTGSGSIILKKNNPSGLPKNDDSLEININFD